MKSKVIKNQKKTIFASRKVRLFLFWTKKNITSAAGGGQLCAEICGKIKTSPTQPQNRSDYIHSY